MTGGECAGYVLAGGRSTRMGRDKALLTVEGQTLLARAAAAVQEAAGSVVIVGPRERYRGLGYEVIEDRFPGAGPLAGIEAALAHSEAEWNLITACDMPGLNAVGLRGLLARRAEFPEADVLLPEQGGYAQPLCAVYRTSALGRIREALDGGEMKILRAIEPLRPARIAMGDGALFQNVNTPAEWEAARMRSGGSEARA